MTQCISGVRDSTAFLQKGAVVLVLMCVICIVYISLNQSNMIVWNCRAVQACDHCGWTCKQVAIGDRPVQGSAVLPNEKKQTYVLVLKI